MIRTETAQLVAELVRARRAVKETEERFRRGLLEREFTADETALIADVLGIKEAKSGTC